MEWRVLDVSKYAIIATIAALEAIDESIAADIQAKKD